MLYRARLEWGSLIVNILERRCFKTTASHTKTTGRDRQGLWPPYLISNSGWIRNFQISIITHFVSFTGRRLLHWEWNIRNVNRSAFWIFTTRCFSLWYPDYSADVPIHIAYFIWLRGVVRSPTVVWRFHIADVVNTSDIFSTSHPYLVPSPTAGRRHQCTSLSSMYQIRLATANSAPATGSRRRHVRVNSNSNATPSNSRPGHGMVQYGARVDKPLNLIDSSRSDYTCWITVVIHLLFWAAVEVTWQVWRYLGGR